MIQLPLYNFMNLPPELMDLETAQYAILPVPYEGTVTFMPGASAGPKAILDASTQVEQFDEEFNRDFTTAGITTLSTVSPADTPQEQMVRVGAAAEPAIAAGKFLISLGGEHSITAPLVEAVSGLHGPVSVLQIDAHADLRDSYGGTTYSHACVMRRVLEVTDRICQVGIRNYSQEEYAQCMPYIQNALTPKQIESDPGWIDRALSLLGEQVYVTIDIDGLDPSLAPGTGTPEPGGLTWRQVLSLLRRVCTERHVLAADIVEVAPIRGSVVTEFAAARLAYKIIAYTQLPRQRHTTFENHQLQKSHGS